MQVIILNLNESGKIIIAVDACPTEINLVRGELPKNFMDHERTLKAIQCLLALKMLALLFSMGHDPSLK